MNLIYMKKLWIHSVNVFRENRSKEVVVKMKKYNKEYFDLYLKLYNTMIN